MKIVGLVGPKRSGKSTAAAALVQQRGFVEVGFADAVKDLALHINPIVPDAYGQPWRLSETVEECGWEFSKGLPEVRRFLQELGTGVRDIDPDFWINTWRDKVGLLGYEANIVVPDVRFLNEAVLLDIESPLCETLLIRVTRPGLDLSDTHVSETAQAGIKCDVEIVNNYDGTPGDAADFQQYVLDEVDAWLS